MSLAASRKRPANSSSFTSNKLINHGENKQDEFFDIDDDLLSGFKTDDENDEVIEEEVDDLISEEAVTDLTNKVMRWRDPGTNCGIRNSLRI